MLQAGLEGLSVGALVDRGLGTVQSEQLETGAQGRVHAEVLLDEHDVAIIDDLELAAEVGRPPLPLFHREEVGVATEVRHLDALAGDHLFDGIEEVALPGFVGTYDGGDRRLKVDVDERVPSLADLLPRLGGGPAELPLVVVVERLVEADIDLRESHGSLRRGARGEHVTVSSAQGACVSIGPAHLTAGRSIDPNARSSSTHRSTSPVSRLDTNPCADPPPLPQGSQHDSAPGENGPSVCEMPQANRRRPRQSWPARNERDLRGVERFDNVELRPRRALLATPKPSFGVALGFCRRAEFGPGINAFRYLR